MTLEEILDEWKKDAKMDRSELAKEASNVQNLHQKYLKHYVYEKLALKQLEIDLRKKNLEVYTYYTEGPSKETAATRDPKEFPARGKILRNDAPKYVEVDKEIIDLQLKVEYSKAKVEALEQIVKAVSGRGFLIKDAITFIRWQGGEG
jgi:hypothetical protein